MDQTSQDHEFVAQVFSGALTLLAILIGVAGVLLGLYEAAQGDSELVASLRVLTLGASAAVILAGVTSGLSLVYLRGRQMPVQWIVRPLIVLIVAVSSGVPIVVLVRLF